MSSDGNTLWRIKTWFPDLDEASAVKLKKYHSELLRYNVKLNLIGRQTERDADEQHFSDCLLASRLVLSKLDPAHKLICDLGSGNGLPGVVLAILAESIRPTLKVRLIDSDERKCEFLKSVVVTLGLKQAEVVCMRIEEIKEPFSAAITRGLASISKVCLSCKNIIAPGGLVFHLKGSNWFREVGEMPSQLASFWAPELSGEYSLPVSQAKRAIVATRKLK
ncbi:MAG: 16S rRNA (guanine(527)-N(7))-methyltransferase RsmG [Bdellovibrionales bacterium]|nr:16S rRNA (guanine(527)-N(7))-methyltransferase RsmG [Bdellovibrionales bacterium]